MNHSLFRHLCTALLSFGVLLSASAQEAGESVSIDQPRVDDVYAAAGKIDVVAPIGGDLVVAGGRVFVDQPVSGDMMAAGGSLQLISDVNDDLRGAGGEISLRGTVGDDVILAGGEVALTRESDVGGRAWLAGGYIEVGGRVNQELRAAGGQILISGQINGDVILAGRGIHILDGAVIEGDLHYRSPEEAFIAEGARIGGSITFVPIESPDLTLAIAAAASVGILFLLSLYLTGLLFFLLFTRFVKNTVTTIRTEPWKSLGLGLAMFAATPIVILLLFATFIAWLPALLIGFAYLVLLLAGLLMGVFFVAGFILQRVGKIEAGRLGWMISFLIAGIIVTLLGIVPLAGQLLIFLVTLFGIGALTLRMFRAYSTESAA